MDFSGGIDQLYSRYCIIRTLLEVTRIDSPSGYERELSEFCELRLSECGFMCIRDKYGNIMARRGNKPRLPLLNAHMDTTIQSSRTAVYGWVEPIRSYVAALQVKMDDYRNQLGKKLTKKEKKESNKFKEDLELDIKKFIIDEMRRRGMDEYDEDRLKEHVYLPDRWYPELIQYVESEGVIRSVGKKQQIGGDDKAGVAIILCLASMTDLEFKVLLTVGEEPPYMAKNGARAIPPEFFDDVLYCITLDRRGSNDLITHIGSDLLCTRNFSEVVQKCARLCGVKLNPTGGMAADILFIVPYCQGVNMSSGYFNPHTNEDYIRVDDVTNTLCVVSKCIERIKPVEYTESG